MSFSGELVIRLLYYFNDKELAILKQETVALNDFIAERLDLTIKPIADLQTDEDISFDWKAISFTETSLTETELVIKIDFSKPFKISESEEPNILKVDFWDIEVDIEERNLDENELKKEPKLSREVELPKQLSEDIAAVMAVAGESVEGSSKATLYAAFFFNLFLGLSMN